MLGVMAYGHWGRPVLAFPAENGNAADWERNGMIDALGGHICRCTGYVKIVDAVIAASRGEVHVAELDELLVPEPDEPEVEIKGAPA